MAFFKFLGTAAWAGVIAANIFQRVARRFLMAVVTVRAVHMAVIMAVVIMLVIAVGAVNVVLLGHAVLLRDVIAWNYLAIARHVHALSKQPTRFDGTLKPIMDRLVGFI